MTALPVPISVNSNHSTVLQSMNLSSVPARCKKEPVLSSQPVLKNLPLFLPAVRRTLSSGLSQLVLKNLSLFLLAIRRNLSSILLTCIKETAPAPASCKKEPVLYFLVLKKLPLFLHL
jgi:hypothetical protein